MSLIEKLNLVTNERLKAKLLAKFNDQTDPKLALNFLQNWRNFNIAFHVFLGIISFSIVPIAYYFWAKKTQRPSRNWFTKPYFETIEAIQTIKKPPLKPEAPQDSVESDTDSLQPTEKKSNLAQTEPKDIESVLDEVTCKRLEDDETGKYYLGSQQGFLYIIKDGKAEKIHLKNSPILHIDITKILECDELFRIILVCHKNGSMDIYHLDDLSKKISLPGVGKWFTLDPENNTISFDNNGNLQSNRTDGKYIIMVKEQIIDRLRHPEKYLTKVLAKERRKLTNRVQSTLTSEEDSDNQTETNIHSNSSL